MHMIYVHDRIQTLYYVQGAKCKLIVIDYANFHIADHDPQIHQHKPYFEKISL